MGRECSSALVLKKEKKKKELKAISVLQYANSKENFQESNILFMVPFASKYLGPILP